MAKSDKRFQRELEREASNFDRMRRRASREGRVSSEPVEYPEISEEAIQSLMAPEPTVEPEIDYMSGISLENPGANVQGLGDLSGGMDDLDTEQSQIHNIIQQLANEPRNEGTIKAMLENEARKKREEQNNPDLFTGQSNKRYDAFSEGL